MGDVYRALEVKSGLEVAIKVSRHATRDARERFQREVHVSARVSHPHVVEILDYGEATLDGRAGVPFLVMELLDGKTLGEVLAEEMPALDGTLARVEYFLRLIRQAALGLHAAHQAGIVHRDVKPDNLILHGNSAAPSVKLIDFGLASLADEAAPAKGMIAGTIEYMAPEQVLTEATDARADIYSLGVVMFRLLTGVLPFDGALRTQLLALQLLSPAPSPSWLVDDLPAGVDRIVSCAMRKHPGNRYPDMSALVTDIDAYLSSASVTGTPLLFEPDSYTPATELGAKARDQLRSIHG